MARGRIGAARVAGTIITLPSEPGVKVMKPLPIGKRPRAGVVRRPRPEYPVRSAMPGRRPRRGLVASFLAALGLVK